MVARLKLLNCQCCVCAHQSQKLATGSTTWHRRLSFQYFRCEIYTSKQDWGTPLLALCLWLLSIFFERTIKWARLSQKCLPNADKKHLTTFSFVFDLVCFLALLGGIKGMQMSNACDKLFKMLSIKWHTKCCRCAFIWNLFIFTEFEIESNIS